MAQVLNERELKITERQREVVELIAAGSLERRGRRAAGHLAEDGEGAL